MDVSVKRVTCCNTYLESHGKLNTVRRLFPSERVRLRCPFPRSGLISTFLHEHHLVQRVVDENTEQGLNKNEHKKKLLTV